MILEEMYNGRFYPCETVVADSSRSKQLKSPNNMRGKASPIPPNRKARRKRK